ncbi:MAG TPA: DUF3379 family protein [Rudaea sp.]|jgi:hypothetical protein
MNCIEFRRQLGIDPQSAAAGFVRHRQECARCAEAAARAAEFETALRRALQIAPSPQLAESILLAQATQQNRRQAYLRRGGLLALAATLVLAVGIGMRVEATPLSTQAVEHLREEAEVLTSVKPLPAESVRAAFAQRGLKLANIPAGVAFVGCCPMGRHLTVHMVMPEGDGPVTVIYVVDRGSSRREDFQRDGWRGRSLPLGKGTLILLARDTDHFDGVEAAWRTALAG